MNWMLILSKWLRLPVTGSPMVLKFYGRSSIVADVVVNPFMPVSNSAASGATMSSLRM